jgi:hypothetical protein
MKLFLIIYAGSQIGGVIGPLPYDLAECQSKRDALRAGQAQTIASGIHAREGRKLTDEEIGKLRSLRFECEYFGKRPSLGA